jgi:teichuronic acid biosynthesis glycosyltransferase TuaC
MSPSFQPRMLVVAANYPSPRQPGSGAFIRAFVRSMVDAGACAEVIHPVSLFSRLHGPLPKGGIDETAQGKSIRLHRPRYPSFSARDLGFMNTARLTQVAFERAALRPWSRLSIAPTITYGHFLYFAGRTAVRIGTRLGIPSFVAVGEGEFWTARRMGPKRPRLDFRPATGLLAVSTVLKEKLIAELAIPEEKIGVFSNGVDLRRFQPRDRLEMRKKFHLPADRFIVAYVGNFLAGKGVGVLAEALNGLEGTSSVFVGSGPLTPEGDHILFRDTLPHDQIPEILSAADVFVMPSFVEGSCNAVIEAMACGLPVVASNGRFHDDILDDSASLRVDTTRPDAIREAVAVLRDDPVRRKELSRCAVERARQFDIRVRAERVLAWMQERIQCAGGEGGTP